jgi:hypothetical protein
MTAVKSKDPKRKDFIGFILAAEEDEKLTKEFLSKKEVKVLYLFFKQKGFTEIREEPDCEDILTARRRLEKVTIGEIIEEPCPANAKY